MTRIDPDEVLKAADHFADANGAAAVAYGTLKGWIASSGNMAGDDKTSEDFAGQYDTAAKDAMHAAAEMVDALAGMARLVYLTAGNHSNANLASVYSANPPELNACVPPDTTVSVTPYTPPSSVGGDDPNTPDLWDKITDYLEGYTWPGADVDTLRSVGDAWKKFQTTITESVLPHIDSALSVLRQQDSADIDTAIGVISNLKLEVDELGHHVGELGSACRGYADQVEAVRETVKDILKDLAIEVGITAVVAGGLAFFTAGISAGGGTAIAGWRLASAGRKVVKAFSAMKAAVKVGAVAKIVTAGRKIPFLAKRFRRVSDAANAAKHSKYVEQLRKAMGKPTGGKWHSQKAEDKIRELEKWLKNNPKATPGDRAAAENVIRDMQDALNGN
ncbi:MAG: hypothetical protein ACI379_06705 [Nocardioides sp.]|uniref:WXG100-like domain-containing protein n=1 Tax=Nocardioides sp. TaxID=35761 RepID=UPI003F0B325E